jgi:hypothetical protein
MGDDSMNKDDDLDWLARNVNRWGGAGDNAVVDKTEDGVLYARFPIICAGGITKGQWLARRAELQSKPSWDAVPTNANWMAQDCSGTWVWHSGEPEPRNGMWIGGVRGYAGKGEVIGDWRDTLEKRQEPASSGDWHERGELPPVGIECEIFTNGKWEPAFIVGKSRKGGLIVQDKSDCAVDTFSCQFRPIRTERDLLAEVIINCGAMSGYQIADAILAAGFTKKQ